MKTFSQHVKEKLLTLRQDRMIADDIHGWAYLSYLIERLKLYLMDEERTEDFEEDNQELIKLFSYISALAQHCSEELKLTQREENGDATVKHDLKLFPILQDLFSHIVSHKKECLTPPQKSQGKWWNITFSEEQIKSLGTIIREQEENDSISE